jgi:methionine synthase II (cobalamin-independent)
MEWKFATTLIGSMPYDNAKAAVDVITAGKINVPAWPQLTARGFGESMYMQTGAHLPGLHAEGDRPVVDLNAYDPTEAYTAIVSDDADYFSYPKDICSGFYEFIGRDLSGFAAVKGQVTGPISEGLQIISSEGRPVIYDESYGEIVRKTVNMSAKWQARALSRKNDKVILFFDEPSLSMLGTPFTSISDDQAKQWINESLDGVDCFRAVHCCGNTNWSLLLGTNIDILSIDAYQYGQNLLMYPDELASFLRKGGNIAWGIVPNGDETVQSENVATLVDRMEEIFAGIESKGIDRRKAALHSILTPQCGLGGMRPENVDRALMLLSGVSAELRRRYEIA